MKCCVIIPVGPGHKELSQRVIHSIEQAIASGIGPFSEVEILPQDDTLGLGRSRARNLGVIAAGKRGADWIFFIDADELMAPNAFNEVAPLLDEYDAIWGAIYEANLATQEATRRNGDIAPIASLDQLLLNHPFLTLHNGHFVRYQIALEHPFNTEMDCGEDFEYYLRVWRDSRCIKIERPLFFNVRGQHSTGPRAATGKDWNDAMPQVFTSFCLQNDVVAHVPLGEVTAHLRLSNTLDPIQNQLANERLVEAGELEELIQRLPDNGSVLDIGAHIGSHSICLALLGKAAKIDAFEKDRVSSTLLEYNLRLNNLGEDTYHVHRLEVGYPQTLTENTDKFGRIELDKLISPSADTTLDLVLPDSKYDLIRVSLESPALDVLQGAAQIIERCRPLLLIKTANGSQQELLEQWLVKNGYEKERSFDHGAYSNHLLAPSN
ncbi:glycosyltransferase [Pseudomonas knackmussii]|uniref:glycosyltransferase n=1 Tax=Pseudomonas knackmussii TaxID=65741 RepID=UPI001363216B|nr:glycosyltransferase [Pseudomonas knackmussii]